MIAELTIQDLAVHTQSEQSCCSHSQNGQQTVWRRQTLLLSTPGGEWHAKKEALGFEWTLAAGTTPYDEEKQK